MIETPRLYMRKHRRDDFPKLAAMWADPRVVEHIGGKPSTRQQSWSRLLNYAGHWALMDYGYWAVEERESGEYIGDVGFSDFHREMVPSIEGVPELGWVLAPQAQEKGYATEATLAAIGWAQANLLEAERISCIIAPENQPSIRVAKTCGFTLPVHATYLDSPTLLCTRSIAR